MATFDKLELWWITGAQLLYGGETVKIVDGHSKEMVEGLNSGGLIPIKVVYKGTANSSQEVEKIMLEANNAPQCAGVITWMHTFSPAKMWIKGLQRLNKPMLHFHTQYNAEIPWDTMDMDFMNLNQSAHGDIEFGHICTRMRVPRKVVVGYWKSKEAQEKIAIWARVAAAVADAHDVRCLMFGMNMNNVAVTDGDRVEFEQRLGYHVDYYPVSSLMDYFKRVTDAEVAALVDLDGVELFVLIDEGICLSVGDLLEVLHQRGDGVVVHMIAQTLLELHTVAIGDGHIVHVHTEHQTAHVVGISHTGSHTCPDGNLLLGVLVLPVAADHLAGNAHTGADMSELDITVSTLVEVHEVHVHGLPGDLSVVLCVEVEEGLLQLLQTLDPHLGG